MIKKLSCITGTPILLIYVPFIKVIALILLILVLIYMIGRSIFKKRKKETVKDNRFWMLFLSILFFIVIIFSPIVWDSGSYLLLNYALPLAVFIIGAIILKKLSLLGMKKGFLIILGILLLVFVALFVFDLFGPKTNYINADVLPMNQSLGCGSKIF